jgi:hypothetical protein
MVEQKNAAPRHYYTLAAACGNGKSRRRHRGNQKPQSAGTTSTVAMCCLSLSK